MRITEALLQASTEVGLEVNTEKTMHMFMFRHQNAGQNYNLLFANKPFESVVKFRYLRTIHEESKRRLNSGNICYHSVQTLLSSLLLFKNLQLKTCKTTILPVVLYGCEIWSVTLREAAEDCMRSFITCTVHHYY
jgi:hypothetical protein